MADGNIKITIEPAIHGTLAETLQHIWREHGIRVDNVRADWLDVSPLGERDFSLQRVDLDAGTDAALPPNRAA